jgi:hypothetical protein
MYDAFLSRRCREAPASIFTEKDIANAEKKNLVAEIFVKLASISQQQYYNADTKS